MKHAGTAALILAIAVLVPAPAGWRADGADPGALADSEKLGRDAQRELARLGCFTGDASESWGRDGRAAIKRFNQASQVTWPDWPTAGLVDALRTYEDGYCGKCRDGGACTASAPSAPESRPSVPPVATRNEEVPREKPAEPVSAPVRPTPAPPPDVSPSVVNPGDQERASLPVQPPPATAAPEPEREANTGKPDSVIEQPPAVKEPEKHDDAKRQADPPEKRPASVSEDDDEESGSVSQRKRAAQRSQNPKPRAAARSEPAPASPPAPRPQRGVPGGGAWPGSGPNLDGR